MKKGLKITGLKVRSAIENQRKLNPHQQGDAVATKDFWAERRPYYNALDVAESKRTMEKINSLADIIVPGHDNYFLNCF